MIYIIRRFSQQSDKTLKVDDNQVNISEANKFKTNLQRLTTSMGNSGDLSLDSL